MLFIKVPCAIVVTYSTNENTAVHEYLPVTDLKQPVEVLNLAFYFKVRAVMVKYW